MKRFLKISRYVLGSVLLLMVTIVVLINLSPVQNFLAKKATEVLSQKLKTKVVVAHVRIDFLNHLLLQGLYMEDQHRDTLLYAGEAQVRITDWFIFREKPVLTYIGLQNAYVHLYRTPDSKDWNYAFIADAFSTGKKSSSKSKPFEFDLEKMVFQNVRFHMDDKWGGEDLDFDFGDVAINARDLNFDKKILDVKNVAVKNANISINEYKGGRPPRPRGAKDTEEYDPTPFNTDNWRVKVADVTLDGCSFRLTSNNKTPDPNLFDENHLAIRNINVAANGISIVGDTVRGNVDAMTAQERCGLTVKKMHSRITVSPVASICEQLYLETNYSKVQDYYAMHYRHFPDFLSYIDSVKMVARLKESSVDIRDIEYFAPQLKIFPNIVLRASGEGQGTVANLSAKNMVVSDGNSALKGNITMKGLPDIYTTYITFTDGQIFTSGKGILRYAPGLKNNPNVALEHLTYAMFRGKYEGYVENFSLDGVLNSNLGNVSTDMKMKIPGFKSSTASYTGTVEAQNLAIGTLLQLPLLGNISFNENISGSSFNPDEVQLNISGYVQEIEVKGYPYRNITTHGMLAKKEFQGSLLVDDPNLALEFDGGINYNNKDININAKAHLLGSNFKALHLTADTITATADLDLNFTGSNIDNFSGYAKLFNIDLRRNSRKLALDSVYVNSTGSGAAKKLTIESNAVVASMKGNYQLSSLPASIQYYLSRYLPNYIPVPQKNAPDQNFEFTIETTAIDSIFAVTLPFMRGFDSSSVSGSLNTAAQKLTLNADVPYGTIGKFHMSHIVINGTGNLNNIAVGANIDNVAVGDSFLNGSLSLTTTVGNDSIGFTIATTTIDTSDAITLNGQIIARKDSLFLTLFPSQFYLNQYKWDIAGGSKVLYSNNYLLVQGLTLTSGLQRITANTELNNNSKDILISTENLDLGQLGSWAGLAAYQPDGRVNGTIKVDKIFQDLYVTANIKADGVLLGPDTIGTVNIIGSYDGSKKLVNFDPQTGIYHGNGAVTVSGNISFDSTTYQKIDGAVHFDDAPVTWASAFLVGIMSHLGGKLNGAVNFSGTSSSPVIAGNVVLTDAGFHLDYMGTNYTIPSATIEVDNHRISFGTVQVLDSRKNKAMLTGYFRHNEFKDMRMHINIASSKFEVLNINSIDNNIFYGNVTAGLDSFTIRGPFNNITMHAYNAVAAAKSHITIPVSSGGSLGSYSYVSFKTYGKNQEKLMKRSRNKLHITIDAHLTDLAEMSIVLDPATGDNITAKGEGSIQLDIPADNDIRINGLYTIDEGSYTYTLQKLYLKRVFTLSSNSTIRFNGPFMETALDVDATYPSKARLYDLLSDAEKTSGIVTGSELTDAQTTQIVNVVMHMNGPLQTPKFNFDLDLPDKHSVGTYAYTKFIRINQDDQQKFEQVASLLLINQFIPPEGVGGGAALSGGINNISQFVSSSASSGLTAIVNKLSGNKQVNVDVQYVNYNYSDQAFGALNRSQVKVGVNKNYLNDRLTVEVGSTSDWGHPTSASATSNFNIAGDFRVQYQLSQFSGLRLNAFSTSDYDVTLDRDIQRNGVGISWRKSFDNVGDFFRGNKYAIKQKDQELKKLANPPKDSLGTPPPNGGQ